jgi:hypothetical protein
MKQKYMKNNEAITKNLFQVITYAEREEIE